MTNIEYHVDINALNNSNQRQLILLVGAIFIGISLSTIALVFFFDYATTPVLTNELFAIAVTLSGLKLAYSGNNLLTAARLIIYSSLLCKLFFIYQSSGIFSAVTLFLPIYPMLATVLLKRREYLVILFILITAIFGLGYMQLAGHPFLEISSVRVQTFSITLSLSLVFAFVAAVFNHSIGLNSQLSEKILAMASHDYLTGILNRRAIDITLDNEMQRAKRDKSWLSVVMIDVDFFKLYNDQHGHLKGDSCLQTIAHTIQGNLRNPPDAIGRYGGEEFLLVLPNTDSQSALNVAERIQGSIKAQKLGFGINDNKNLTVTIGIVTSKLAPEDSSDLLINIADKCLYKGKANGRDNIVHTERYFDAGTVNLRTVEKSNAI